MTKQKFGLSSFLAKLRRDHRGSIVIQFTITLVAIMGFVGLALDGGRLLMLHSDLQKLADAAALAGAAKLDGTANAITNADTAARNLVNTVRWWDVSGANILAGTAGVQFYSSLNPDTVTTNPKTAGYIKVTTGSWQVAPSFLAAAATSNSATTARAWAKGPAATGLNGGGATCLPQTMLLCNPSEPVGGGTGNASSFNPTRGQMFVFSTTGNTGGFSPGVFSLLDTPSGSGSDPDIARFLSQQTTGSCGTQGTSPAQGQKTNATINGINVRFDQTPSGQTSGYNLTPAPIKIDGLAFGTTGGGAPKCNQSPNPVSGSYPLPLDRDLPLGGASSGRAGFGSGPTLADLQAYWSNHHSTSFPAGATTRYDLYLAEAAAGPGFFTTDSAEPHGPVCLPTNSPDFVPRRRVLHVAVVDCVYWGVQGNAVNNIPINRYADFFITHPVSNGGASPSPIFPTPTSTPPYGVTTAGATSQQSLWGDAQIYTEFIGAFNANQGSNGAGGSGNISGVITIIQLVR